MDKRNAPSHEDALLIKLTCDSTIKYTISNILISIISVLNIIDFNDAKLLSFFNMCNR